MSRFLLCFLVSALFAEEAPLTLPPAAKDYLPKGWKVHTIARGDLNADGLADLVFIREEQDPKKISKRDDGFAQNSNPRTLVVLLATKDGFAKLVECPKLIPPEFDPNKRDHSDALRGIKVEKNVLTIAFYHKLNIAAPMWAYPEECKFRLEAGRLRLIGSELSEVNRFSGRQFRVSTNYLTGRQKTTTGLNAIVGQPSHPKDSWDRIEVAKPIYIEDLPPCEGFQYVGFAPLSVGFVRLG